MGKGSEQRFSNGASHMAPQRPQDIGGGKGDIIHWGDTAGRRLGEWGQGGRVTVGKHQVRARPDPEGLSS